MFFFFFFNDTATTEIYTLSLHDALPISFFVFSAPQSAGFNPDGTPVQLPSTDRRSTRLNSSHSQISYAVFCLKKKKTTHYQAPVRLGAQQIHMRPAPPVSSTTRAPPAHR